jgi:hypothetical protein
VASASQNKRAGNLLGLGDAQHQASQYRHEGLMGERVATKQIAQVLQLIGRWRKTDAHTVPFHHPSNPIGYPGTLIIERSF